MYFLNTSYDIINTAEMARFKAALKTVIVPGLKELLRVLAMLAIAEAHTVQIGRTHRMHAVPITYGFAIAVIVDRLGKAIQNLERLIEELEGKMSGAVGAFNPHKLFLKDPIEFEERVLARMDLKVPLISTQVVKPEPICRVLNELVIIASITANLADNTRSYQQTEVGEVEEAFGKNQVGSSTMAHKRNPLKSEQVKGIWKILMGRIIPPLLNLLTDFERDLTNSISSRPDVETLAYFHLMVKTMAKTAKGWQINRDQMIKNLQLTKGLISAEPLQLVLASLGHPDSHEVVRKISMQIQESTAEEKPTLWEVATSLPEIEEYVKRMTPEQIETIKNPAKYIGLAPERATRTARYWIKEFGLNLTST